MALATKNIPGPSVGGSWDREMGEVRGWRCRRDVFFNVKLWIFENDLLYLKLTARLHLKMDGRPILRGELLESRNLCLIFTSKLGK